MTTSSRRPDNLVKEVSFSAFVVLYVCIHPALLDELAVVLHSFYKLITFIIEFFLLEFFYQPRLVRFNFFSFSSFTTFDHPDHQF